MTFTFNNYATNELSKSPINDIIENMLGGYEHAKKAQYLEPSLAEQLKKSQLANKWYEPNMESQIGLRGAQAGHLGAMTQGLNISNPFLRQKLEDEASKRQFELQNPLLNMTGPAGQIGALLHLQQHPELMRSTNQNSGAREGQSYIPPIMGGSQSHQETQSLNPMELLQQSLMNSLQGKGKERITPLESAQHYADAQAQLHGKDSEEARLAKNYVNKIANGTKREKNEALEQHRERQDNMAVWKSLPANAKAHAIAIGQGAGFSADETAHWLAAGKSMKDLLYQHGIKDESDVEPVYQLTGSAQSQLLQRQFASKEADYLSDFIRKNTGEYARTVAGYSPKLMKDQLNGKNEEQQAKALASRGLAQELVNLRLVLANAKSTVAAQKQMMDKSMLAMKNFRSLVSPKVWSRSQEVMDSTLQKMFKHAKTGFGQKISASLMKEKNSDNDPLGIR